MQRVNNANRESFEVRNAPIDPDTGYLQAICRLFEPISSRIQAMTGTAMSANVELLVWS